MWGKVKELMPSISKESVSQEDILSRYFGISSVPRLINSPFRGDNKPSFSLYYSASGDIRFKDFATNEAGSVFDMLERKWNTDFSGVMERLYYDNALKNNTSSTSSSSLSCPSSRYRSCSRTDGHLTLQCKVRKWRKWDIEYWQSYGIPVAALKYAEVYPVSHKFVTYGDTTCTYTLDRYAYAFIERKEGNITMKIYQPFNKKGYKWSTSNDKSVLGLWTKVPQKGKWLCICSSLKDALCLWQNTGIPAVYIQGEGFSISKTALDVLKSRFENIRILLDNDKPGIDNSIRLSKETGLPYIILPFLNDGKDVSDMFKIINDKKKFREIFIPLIKNS